MSPNLWPVADHLWQSTLFAALVGLLTLAFRDNRAATRYWLWFAASAKFLVPFSLLEQAGNRVHWRAPAALSQLTPPPVIAHISQPFTGPVSLPTAPATLPWSPSLIPTILLLLWAIGFVTLLCSWGLRLHRIRQALRAGSPMPLPIHVPTRTSAAISEPSVFGIFRPVLLMPTGIEDQLTQPQLDAIIAHELCHIRRRDNLTGAIHMAVEAIFWFHPMVWWIGARLMESREAACDEDVLQHGHNPEVYAEGILAICRLYLAQSMPVVAGVTGSNLKQRIETIMSNRIAHTMTLGKKLLLTAAGTAALTMPIAIGILNAPPMRAQVLAAQAIQAPPTKPTQQPKADSAPLPSKTQPRTVDPQTKQAGAVNAQASPKSTPATPPVPANASAAVIIVLDRSSSMEGQKMQWARQAAARVVQSLRPGDIVGILAFDNTFNWTTIPSNVQDLSDIAQQLDAIRPGGGTQIAPALKEAYTRVVPIPAKVKHIILLTDGIAEAGDSLDLARNANGTVSISTVGLGADVNTNYLETIAKLSGGASYFATKPQELEGILLRDVAEQIGLARPTQ